MSWYENAIIYHIYPLGFCGAPKFNEGGEPVNRLEKVLEWIPHFQEMNIDAVYFGPVFESVEHGYDTTDYKMIDRRLGTNEMFKNICDKLHEAGIRVILDGVFNHVGRKFWAFTDVQQNGQNSPYCSWFQNLNFGGQSPCGDPFWYEGWNGHYNLVKLNLQNQNVCDHLLDAVNYWMEEFKIDGIRFDAADCIDFNFFKRIRSFCKGKNPEFWLMGEIIHGDYNRWANPEMLDSVTNYECYKGIYSSHNDKNYFEIDYSINRQHGTNGGIYRNLKLYTFVDNHDVNRIASAVNDKRYLYTIYTLLYCMPGIPSIYYGSEFGIEGRKGQGPDADAPLRPCLNLVEGEGDLNLYRHIVRLGRVYRAYPALRTGSYRTVIIRNRQLVFAKELGGQTVYVCLNLDDQPFDCEFGTHYDRLVDVLGSSAVDVSGGNAHVHIEPFSSMILVHDNIENLPPEPKEEPVEEVREIHEGQHYRHYKGGRYTILGVATHSETLEDMVVYRSEDDNSVWVRPKAMFMDKVNNQYRFTLLDD
ncbi:MAG: DUF1653 domain-containing protein [Oscillospiraceae bacterium]|nr:DUF1653 domain-containing protein [Oscillospiraceae bacterium]